jgi:uncharacterized membrane protein YphA (DoxX/SURF4 family)
VSLGDHFKRTTSLAHLAIPRIVVGYYFVQFGWQKLAPRFLSGEQFTRQLARASADPLPFHRDFILHFVTPHAYLFAHLVAYGEIAIGLSLFFGCLVRLSCFFAVFHNLNILFAIALPAGGVQVGLNRIFIVFELMFLFASAGRALGLDALLKKRFPQTWLF